MATAGTILLADDEPAIRHLLEQLLAAHGYSVVSARDGREAMQLIPEACPDLLLLDWMMSDVDGLTACKRLKEEVVTRQLPIILMTASPDIEDIWRSSGADAVIKKPFNRNELLAWTRCLVAMRRAGEDYETAEATLISVAAAIEARSLYREDHIKRVTRVSVQLAAALGLGADAIEVIRKAALLHDVGMIWLPEHILRQPGPLTAEQFDLVKRHPVRGAALCASLPRGKEISAIVRGHHERWDGQGYPDGLKGADIPLGARMVAVADAFDALTTDRPFRSALTPQEAFDVLWDGAGTEWDPHLVELLHHIVMEPAKGARNVQGVEFAASGTPGSIAEVSEHGA